jgi:histidinol-phosphate aminotransferase
MTPSLSKALKILEPPILVSSQGNFVCVETKIGGSNIFNALLKEGVIVRSLDLYAMPRHIRVTIGSEEENKFFIDKLDKVISS